MSRKRAFPLSDPVDVVTACEILEQNFADGRLDVTPGKSSRTRVSCSLVASPSIPPFWDGFLLPPQYRDLWRASGGRYRRL
jgi:hypothetical protein